jgi:acyl-ACP thioesterase
MVAVPSVGRVYTGRRRVRLGDATPAGRLRLDALARYVQDVANDDTRDAGFGDVLGWVVRRTVVEVERFPVYLESLVLSTWCSGIGSRWAERRCRVVGDRGGLVETATLWVHLDAETMRPKPLPEEFHALFGPAAGGRVVRARLQHAEAPTVVSSRDTFALRFADFDVLRHVNNAAYWVVVEEELARRRELRAPLRTELEHRVPIGPGAGVEIVVEDRDGGTALWLRDDRDATVFATATVEVGRAIPAP